MKKEPAMHTLELQDVRIWAGQESDRSYQQPSANGLGDQANSLKGEARGVDDPGFVLSVRPFG
jgi:hypothetical protein